MKHSPLILASSSSTRKLLMDRLGIDYQCISPDIDESPQAETHADDLAMRLAYEKAKLIANTHPQAIVIGSDQVAWREHSPTDFLGKPLTVENAFKQLKANSGQRVFFSTALSVQHQASQFERTLVEHFTVKFRTLNDDEIHRYIKHDQPLHCAGSFKSESLGISLFEHMSGSDQTALMGLPLIQLCNILRELGLQIP